MKSFKTAVILAVASALLLMSACSSNKKTPQTTTKVVYGAGTDTSVVVKRTPYKEVVKHYMRCDSTTKAYKAYIPGPITTDTLHFTLQGERQEITVPATDTDKAAILPVPTTPTPDPDEKSGWDKFWGWMGSLWDGLAWLLGWLFFALGCIVGCLIGLALLGLVLFCIFSIIMWLLRMLKELARWAVETFRSIFSSTAAKPAEEKVSQPAAGPTGPVETAASNVVATVTPNAGGALASRKTTFNGTLVIEETFK